MARPPKFNNPEDMQTAIDAYFDGEAFAEVGDVKIFAPTISGLAYSLGMTTEALRNYEEKPEFLATVKRAKQRVEIALEQKLYGNAVAGTIFNLKNNFGWKDKQERHITGEIGVAGLTDEELADIAAGRG